MKNHEGGLRKLNFKDFGQEPTGSSNPGILWEASTTSDWSIGLGNGALPTTYKGTGYRHNITSSGTYSRAYTKTPGANDWWHTVQSYSWPRFQMVYDFGFRINTSISGNGVVFGYLVEHGGSPSFTETVGYRVRFDGSYLYLEKCTAGVWSLIDDPDSKVACDLDPDQDYYVRITYIPQQFSYMGHTYTEFAGGHHICVTDDLDKRGKGDIAQLNFIDPSPLAGGASTHLMIGVLTNGMSAEFWGVIYSNGFLWKPTYMHYWTGMGIFQQTCVISYGTASQEKFDYLAEGDYVELWLNEPYAYRTLPAKTWTRYKKSYCRLDGMIYRVDQDETKKVVTITVGDTFSATMYGKGNTNIDSGTYSTYYDFICSLVAEYQGAVAYPRRVAGTACINSTDWNISVSATWDSKGRLDRLWSRLLIMANCWLYWDPVTAMLIAQKNPIDTSRDIDCNNPAGEIIRLLQVIAISDKKDNWLSKVIEYHDDGYGAVDTTEYEDTTGRNAYGSSEETSIDVTTPSTEGGLIASNRFDQMNDTTPVYDSIHIVWGSDIGIGCQVGLYDSSKDVDLDYVTCTEIECFYSEKLLENGVPSSLMRLRWAKQEPVLGVYERLPRVELSTNRFLTEKRKGMDAVQHFFT